MKKVLGLDIGTNSIGAALINLPVNFEDYGKEGYIEWIGSRIIPTDGDYLAKFENGQTAGVETKAAARRSKRGARRLKHRYKLRRSRLIKLFKVLGWLPGDFPLDDSREFKKKIREYNDYKFSISDYLPFSAATINEFKTEMGIRDRKRFDKHKNKEVDFLLPEDWIIYYLRKKALTEKIEIPELVRIIYMMNQRRGFKSSRKDLKDFAVLPYNEFITKKENKDYGINGIETQTVVITKIKSVTLKEEKKDKRGNSINVYTIVAEDPRMDSWEETRKKQPEWEGKEFTFLVVQKIDKNGKFTQNKPQIPKGDNWALCTTALDEKINEKDYPGRYFFDGLKQAFQENRNFKIRQYPVYRWRYKQELEKIWKVQCDFNPELAHINTDQSLLVKLAETLYPVQAKSNMPKLAEFKGKDLLHIISNDIIYYQRELKSQKNTISECRYEKRQGIDKEIYGLKCIPRSSPLFQEFRIWQDIHNIRVLEREMKTDGKTYLDVDVTAKFVDNEIKSYLFDLFNSSATVNEKDILNHIKIHKPDNNIKLDIDKKENIHSHRINLFANRKELKGNETLYRYRKLFKNSGFDGEHILSDMKILLRLWHVDYSITSSDEEKSTKGITTALLKLLPDSPNKDKAIEAFTRLPELKKEYGSYSAMAIKKMLPVMRCGKYWQSFDKEIEALQKHRDTTVSKKEAKELDGFIAVLKNIPQRAGEILRRLNDINHNPKRLSEIADDDVQQQVLKSFIGKKDITQGLGTYQAGYLIYDRHSEKGKSFVATAEKFGQYIQKEIPNNSLRNPIVEKVVRETMFLVRDIWQKYGDINEIHIELGRDLKNNTDERKQIADGQKSNFEEKLRIKKLLYELLNEGFEQYIDAEDSKPFDWKAEIEHNTSFEVKPNPENPVDIDRFRIWRSLSKLPDAEWDRKVKDEKIPTEQQVKKYALWLSQNCRSPYTGRIIPLSKLFDQTQYEIEHVIPRKKLKNDSFNNLVIAEWGVNKAKDNELAANFIAASNGKCVYGGIEYGLFTYSEYDAYCKETFKFQKSKRKNLLAIEVPEDFIERQINDTRYIGKKLTDLLAPVTRQPDGSTNENGLVFTIGAITSELKNNWGLNSVWKDIVRPRFERLEKILGRPLIIADETDSNKYHFDLRDNPRLELKRVDHRHHALDALIIAATTREHIRYLNTLSAADTDEEFKRYRMTLVKGKIREFKEPWVNFAKDAKDKLEATIVTFKTSNNIISRPANKYTKWFAENGKLTKKTFEQKPNGRWMAVRRSMFKEPQGVVYLKEVYEERSIIKAVEIQIDRLLVQNTPTMKLAPYVYDQEARVIIKDLIHQSGISIREKPALVAEIKKHLKKNPLKNAVGEEYKFIKIAVFEEYAAKRVKLDNTFDHKKINKIPYAKIGKSVLGEVLHQHLDMPEYEGKPELAFSEEGLEVLAKKAGRPVSKVTITEQKDINSKFGKQYVEVDAGANAYFIMYENQQTKTREGFYSVATHKAIERLTDVTKKGIADVKDGYDLIVLSPNDLVYVPSKDEFERISKGMSLSDAIDWGDRKHIATGIYKMTDTTQGKCLFVLHNVASKIGEDDIELGSGNKSARAWNGEVKYIQNAKGKLSREDSGTMIKDVCIKLKIDRLGNIRPA